MSHSLAQLTVRSGFATAQVGRRAADSGVVETSSINKFAVDDLNFYYGSFQALKHLSIAIPERQITALIGPSGCGKSTFLRCLNRMNDGITGAKHTGTISFDGGDIFDSKTDVIELRKRVGMVFQKPNPFPMSISENILFGPRTHGIRKKSVCEEIVETTLRAVGLWDEVKDKLRASAYALSGGQQQRLCIARVLAVGPEVILLDEPCSALDPISTAKIEELLVTLCNDYTIVMVTHNLQQAARTSHQTAFFMKGELIEFASTEELFTKPKQSETEAYVTGRFG